MLVYIHIHVLAGLAEAKRVKVKLRVYIHIHILAGLAEAKRVKVKLGSMHVVRPSVVRILVLPRRSSQSSDSARILTYPPFGIS